MRHASILLLACVVSCLVVEQRIDESLDDDATGGGGGGELLPLSCGELFAPPWGAGCDDCVAASDTCCALAETCIRSPECLAAARCVNDNLHPGGEGRCYVSEAEGMEQYARVRSCVRDDCRAACDANNFSCAGDWNWPDKTENEGVVWLRVFPATGPEATDFGARACSLLDRFCDQPLAEATASAIGAAALEVDFHFAGYFEADATDDLFGMKVFAEVFWRSGQLQVFTPTIEQWQGFAETTGEPLLAEHGRMQFLSLHDCFYQSASGISVTLTGPDIATPPVVYYFAGVVPQLGKTSTSEDGIAVILNVPPGIVSYRGVIEATGEEVFQGTVFIEADMLTYVRAFPKERP